MNFFKFDVIYYLFPQTKYIFFSFDFKKFFVVFFSINL